MHGKLFFTLFTVNQGGVHLNSSRTLLIISFSAIPVERVKHSSHACIVVTSHGGHIGFLEGLWPRNESYMDRVFYQFMNMVFNNYEELQKILSS